MSPQALSLPLFDTPPPDDPPPEVSAPRLRSPELWAALRGAAQTSQAALEAIAQAAQRFTPRVCLQPPDAVLLELRGSIGLFGGLARLFEQLRAAFPNATVALAPTPRAALAFATAGRACCFADPARFVGRLAPLPLSCLRWPPEALSRLSAMGVRTVGEVLRLPRDGFAQRFGTGLLDALDRLTGRSPDPGITFMPVPRFRARCEPAFESASVPALLQVITPLLASLEGFLRERQRGITALRLTLEHRRHPPTQCVLRLAVPEGSAARFARLLALRLERQALPAPVRRCVLQSGPLLDLQLASATLWQPGEQGGGGSERLPAFVEQLRARLGDAAVQGITLLPGHRPERLTRAVSPGLSRGGPQRMRRSALRSALPWSPGTRPLWLLREPRPLGSLRDGSGHPMDGGRRLTLLAGPERIETGWWDGDDVARDYYVAAAADGARLWIFRERGGQGGWFVQGYFG